MESYALTDYRILEVRYLRWLGYTVLLSGQPPLLNLNLVLPTKKHLKVVLTLCADSLDTFFLSHAMGPSSSCPSFCDLSASPDIIFHAGEGSLS